MKTKHRILGALVLAGFIVLLLPFFLTGKGIPNETVAIKAPPFPDQSVQVAVAPEAEMETPLPNPPPAPTPNHLEDRLVPPSPLTPPPATKPEPVPNNDDVRAMQQETPPHPSMKPATPPLTPPKRHLSQHRQAIKKMVVQHEIVAKKYSVEVAKQQTAWVIQMGSFSNKTNALRLVNRLRHKGYPAFVQNVPSSFGSKTRVLVGPQAQKESAHDLAEQIASDLHVRGVVTTYKPLTI